MNSRFRELRQAHQQITFGEIEYELQSDRIDVGYSFHLDHGIEFSPKLEIVLNREHRESIRGMLPRLLFHIGLFEIISYWKCACPGIIRLEAFSIPKEVENFFLDVLYGGLSEFFYLNGIEHSRDLVRISNGSDTNYSDGGNRNSGFEQIPPNDGCQKVIVPVGGGKDSAVALDILARARFDVVPLLLNPTAAAERVVVAAGFPLDECIRINRTICPNLLQLNQSGYLNGHTPFSAVLASISLTAGVCIGARWIALANESSANEATVHGGAVNHQYSKTWEFEKSYSEHVKQYLTDSCSYFSFLRPWNEIQIAKAFSLRPQYHKMFLSCNRGGREDKWCGNCPKCAFVFLILRIFLPRENLLDIFPLRILDSGSIFRELAGLTEHKPFECIGTVDEVRSALNSLSDAEAERDWVGPLMDEIQSRSGGAAPSIDSYLKAWDTQNGLPEALSDLLKSEMEAFR